jgi:predicted GNAT family N-acyltransferase
MNNYFFSPVEFMSPEYDLCVRLRYKLLRKPLELEFTELQLEEEKNEFHFAAFNLESDLLGCLIFKQIDLKTLKMRQVAIEVNLQGQGIGQFLVHESEKWARLNGYELIVLHARDTAAPFYTKLNYVKEGELFEEVNIPHWFMKKNIT